MPTVPCAFGDTGSSSPRVGYGFRPATPPVAGSGGSGTVTFHGSSQCSDFTGSNATKTTLATTSPGDLVIVGVGSENQSAVFGTPSGNSLTYTNKVSDNTSNRGQGALYVSSVDAVGASGWNISETVTTSLANWGLAAVVLTGASGVVGATNVADFNVVGQLAQLSLTTQSDHSAIVMLIADWQAADHTTRVYQTINGFTPAVGGTGEIAGVRTVGQWSFYMAYWPDAGLAGAKTVGTTTEQWNGGFSIMAVEIKAAAGSSASPSDPRWWADSLASY